MLGAALLAQTPGPTTTTIATTTTTVASNSAPAAQSTDRGVIHQALIDLGVSKESAHTAQIYLAAPLKVLFILIVAFILSRLVSRLSHRMVNGLRLVSPLVQATPRGAARAQTLAGAFTSIFRAVIWVLAVLEILNEFSINLVPFVATATVIGAAVGFGAQSLVKDFLSGLLLLAEDQFGVGDHIAVGTGVNITAGTVESVNLRVTRLRGLDGGILYVPNGDIRILSNDTETDSQALVDVMVPFGTDLVAVGVSAQEAAAELAADPDWAPDFVSAPYFAGVADATGANGLTIRVMALTRPGQHVRIAREMRLRVLERLRCEGVAWRPADVAPAQTPAQEHVDRVRVARRQAEQDSADRLGRVASGRPRRRSRTSAARRRLSQRIAARRAGGAESGEDPGVSWASGGEGPPTATDS
jgi:small-conductance mechanosensitive channel